MKKHIDFDDKLAENIQKYADLYCRGNFTAAVNHLLRKEIKNGK